MPNSNGTRTAVIEKTVVDQSAVGYQQGNYTSLEEKEFESTKAEMGEVREENARLKLTLQRMEKDYQCLQLRFLDVLRQEASKKFSTNNSSPPIDQIMEEPNQLLSLCLGRSPRPREPKNCDEFKTTNFTKLNAQVVDDRDLKSNLTLGLASSKPDIDGISSEDHKIDRSEAPAEGGDALSPSSKAPKTLRNEDDHEVPQANAKRARVSVRVRCDTPTMNDGCQWRKYGQKIAKGNPCPRAYYRCTVAPCCPVRKQVQRCYEDMSILITTYEGTHNHPLPFTATSMASTTSAAASMLLSGSSTSHPSLGSTPTLLNGSDHFGVFDTSTTAKQLYLPKSSNPLLPTITLDLTSSPSSSPTHFNRLSSSLASSCAFPSSLSFSTSESNILPTTWGNGYLKYGSSPFDRTQVGSKQSQEYFHDIQPYAERNHQAPSQVSLTETLTKAITSDPNFKSVIAVALSSMVGGGATHRNQGEAERSGHHLKWGEAAHQFTSHNPLAQDGKGFPSSILNRMSSSDSEK